jgi:hypothetical protein
MALVTSPAASWVSGSAQFRHSPPGIRMPTTGMMMSSTIALTTFPTAAPMTTPTASARAFCFSKNSRKSFASLIRGFPSLSPRESCPCLARNATGTVPTVD